MPQRERMTNRRNVFGPLRAWVAPALGLGLVIGGLAMAAGMAKEYAPFVSGGAAMVVLLFGKWWDSRRGTQV